MKNDQKTNQVPTNQNPVNKSNKPDLSPEQQEWLNSVFVPNLRTQILKSARKDSALTAGERQELAAYREKLEQIAQQELEQKGHHGCQRYYGLNGLQHFNPRSPPVSRPTSPGMLDQRERNYVGRNIAQPKSPNMAATPGCP